MKAGIVFVADKYAILDEQAYYNNIYNTKRRKINENLFQINSQYKTDSQFKAEQNPNRRIRKRKLIKTNGHSQEMESILALCDLIKSTGRDVGYFRSSTKDNNANAKAAALLIESKNSIKFPYSKETDKSDLRDGDCLLSATFSGWYRNDCDDAIIAYINEQDDIKEVCVPPHSTFAINDVELIASNVLDTGEKFEFIVADPPWQNRSVKRLKNYTLDDDVVRRIDISLLSDEGLLFMWITNRKGLFDECKELIKSWNMDIIATWTWLKITVELDPVCEFHSTHKVPYERVLVATRPDGIPKWKQRLPEEFVFASVPMAIHSHKPPLPLLLQCFNVKWRKACEIFARSLLPNTVSIGYETLLVQMKPVFLPTEHNEE